MDGAKDDTVVAPNKHHMYGCRHLLSEKLRALAELTQPDEALQTSDDKVKKAVGVCCAQQSTADVVAHMCPLGREVTSGERKTWCIKT